MPISVQREFQHVYQQLQREERHPLQSLLQPYSHCVYPVGACNLFPDNQARRFRNFDMNGFFITLFRHVADILDCELSRYDLHHAHIIYYRPRRKLAVLFHAKEYPARWDMFPYELGYCQRGSDLRLEEADMRLRSVLWTEGLFRVLNGEGRMPFGTFYESEFGEVLADVYYFDAAFGRVAEALNRGVHVVCYGDDAAF